MTDWYTIEQIDESTYAVSEYGHWEQVHSYLLIGTEKAVLIDTGLGVSDIRTQINRLTDLPVIVLTTHVHWDHIGCHGSFDTFAVHEQEKDWINGHFPLPVQAVRRNLCAQPCDFPEGFDPDTYTVFQGKPSFLLRDGMTIDIGNRKIEVIHTPGHSPGHCVFYEREREYMYTGDLVYAGKLDMYYPTTDPILFAQSIHKIQAYPIRKILPGHYRLDIHPRLIDEIAAAMDEVIDKDSGIYRYRDFSIHR